MSPAPAVRERLDREWVEAPDLGTEAASWVGLSLEGLGLLASLVSRTSRTVDE